MTKVVYLLMACLISAVVFGKEWPKQKPPKVIEISKDLKGFSMDGRVMQAIEEMFIEYSKGVTAPNEKCKWTDHRLSIDMSVLKKGVITATYTFNKPMVGGISIYTYDLNQMKITNVKGYK